MKGKNKFQTILVAALISVVINSCKKDDAPDRDKFLGTWSVSSNGSVSGPLNWPMTITASNSSPDQILIKDFDLQTGTTTIASVSGNSFSFSTQHIGSETVQGSGTYNGTLTFHYTADDGQKVDDVNATARK